MTSSPYIRWEMVLSTLREAGDMTVTEMSRSFNPADFMSSECAKMHIREILLMLEKYRFVTCDRSRKPYRWTAVEEEA